jgi:regulator of nonsense transcripts 3
MLASAPLLNALKAEKSGQLDKEAIQRNHAHYKDAAHASKKDESKKKAAAAGFTSEAKQSGESAAPLGKRAARAAAAAAQKASAQPGPATQPKPGTASAAPPAAKPSPASPSKGKSGRGGGKQPPKPPSTSAGQAASAAASSSPPMDAGAGGPVSATASAPAPAPALAPASSDGPGRRSRPVLGLASRQFEAVLSGAGVTKGGSRREHAGEKEKEKEREREREPTMDGGPSSLERRGRAVAAAAAAGGRKTTTGVRGAAAAPVRLRSPAFCPRPPSSSAKPSRVRCAHRNNEPRRRTQHRRAPWRRPRRTCPRPGPLTAAMRDGTEEVAGGAEAEVQHRHSQIREARLTHARRRHRPSQR